MARPCNKYTPSASFILLDIRSAYIIYNMNAKLSATLARRIYRLNSEFARAKSEGRQLAPFLRRAQSLSAAWFASQIETTKPA